MLPSPKSLSSALKAAKARIWPCPHPSPPLTHPDSHSPLQQDRTAWNKAHGARRCSWGAVQGRCCRGSHARSLTVLNVFSTTALLWQSFTIITGNVRNSPAGETECDYILASNTAPCSCEDSTKSAWNSSKKTEAHLKTHRHYFDHHYRKAWNTQDRELVNSRQCRNATSVSQKLDGKRLIQCILLSPPKSKQL